MWFVALASLSLVFHGCGETAAPTGSTSSLAQDAVVSDTQEVSSPDIEADSQEPADSSDSVSSEVWDSAELDASEPEDAAPFFSPEAGKAPFLGYGNPVEFQVLLTAPWVMEPTDVAFDPLNPSALWVASRADDSFVFVHNPGTPEQTNTKLVDYYHTYADEVSSISFSRQGTFASCQESMNTYNGAWIGDGLAGPTLWPADVEKFEENSESTPGGPHIDSLYGSPLCMGVGWVWDHAFFVFDGEKGDLELFDFQRPHPAGDGDVSGAIKYRYLTGVLVREPGVPSHMAFHAPSRKLFVADTGNHRIIWLDVDSGEEGSTIFNNPDPGTEYKKWGNTVWDVWTTTGTVMSPSGMAVHGNYIVVAEHATGEILAFDLDGQVVNRLDTGRGPGAITGLTVDEMGRVIFVDTKAGEVVRVEP